ncbi:MAG: nucleotide exchange factor GrpE [Corynebacterium sp.]|nr:nucleotide exchange factor GrpE [Corynebacterium sp.]
MSEETQNNSPEEQPGFIPDIDPTVERDVEQALADVAEAEAKQAAASQEAEAEAEADIKDPVAELTEDLQRMTAEYANYRRRSERDRATAIETAKVQVISSLLPVLDDLDLAEKHGDLEGPLKAMNDKLRSAVKSFNVEPFGAEGEAFDPERHEAVQDTSTGDEKVLGTVLRCGYSMGDRVIRTAMVIIADPESSDSEQAE